MMIRSCCQRSDGACVASHMRVFPSGRERFIRAVVAVRTSPLGSQTCGTNGVQRWSREPLNCQLNVGATTMYPGNLVAVLSFFNVSCSHSSDFGSGRRDIKRVVFFFFFMFMMAHGCFKFRLLYVLRVVSTVMQYMALARITLDRLVDTTSVFRKDTYELV